MTTEVLDISRFIDSKRIRSRSNSEKKIWRTYLVNGNIIDAHIYIYGNLFLHTCGGAVGSNVKPKNVVKLSSPVNPYLGYISHPLIQPTPPPGRTIKPGFSIPAIIRLAEAQLGLYKTFKPMGTILTSSPHFMVSCLFRKHLLTYGFVTVDGTEKLHQPKRRASIAGHSISLSFFCTSAVCLLISQNVNKKLIGIFRWTILGPKQL